MHCDHWWILVLVAYLCTLLVMLRWAGDTLCEPKHLAAAVEEHIRHSRRHCTSLTTSTSLASMNSAMTAAAAAAATGRKQQFFTSTYNEVFKYCSILALHKFKQLHTFYGAFTHNPRRCAAADNTHCCAMHCTVFRLSIIVHDRATLANEWLFVLQSLFVLQNIRSSSACKTWMHNYATLNSMAHVCTCYCSLRR